MQMKLVLICLAIIMIVTSLPIAKSHAASLVVLEDAIKRGIDNDADLKDLHEELNKKRIELTQAQQAIQDQAERDVSSIAKPHSLSKDIDLAMKIPNARSGYQSAMAAISDKERTVAFNMTKLYTRAFQSMLTIPKVQAKLDKAKKALSDIKTKQKFALATKQDVETADKELQQVNSELKLAQLDYKNSKIELGDKMGQNLEKDDYTFDIKPTYAKLNQSFIWRLIHLSEKNDLTLNNNISNRKLAEEKVSSTRALYTNKFGSSAMVPVNALYNTQTVDSDLLTVNYDKLLDAIKNQWQGNFLFPFPLPPFVFPIPKAVLQGEYDGLRYFDDIKYSLPVSTLELNKARTAENDARKNLILKIKKTYLDTKTAEENYAQALKAAEGAKETIKAADKKLKTGILSKADYAKLQDDINVINQTILTNQLSYQAALAQLNVDTSGALAPYIVNGILPWKEIDSGLDPLNKVPPVPNLIIGSWALKAVANNITADFSITVNKKLGATDYALITSEGKIVGAKQKLKGKVRHLQIIFNDPSLLKVRIYKKDKVMAEANIDGFGTKGNLVQIEANPGTVPTNAVIEQSKTLPKDTGTLIIGTYKINKNKLTKTNLLAAQATMKKSGQGIYYRSEFAEGAWVNIDKASDLHAIDQTKGVKLASVDQINQLKLTVSVADDGKIASLQTSADIQSDIDSLMKELQQLTEEHNTAIAANKPEQAASLTLQLKDVEAQIAFSAALLHGNAEEAAAQLALMNAPDAALAALPSNPAEANAAAKRDLSANIAQLTAALQKAQAAGDKALSAQLQANIAAATANLTQLQQQIETAQQANIEQSKAADAALDKLNTDKAKLQNDLQLAQNKGDQLEVKQLQQQLADLAAQLLDAQKNSDIAKAAVMQDTAASSGIKKPPAQSDEDKIAALENKQSQLQDQAKQAADQGNSQAANELQLKSLQSEFEIENLTSGITQQIAVFTDKNIELQKSAEDAVKKGDSAAFDELMKSKAQNDTALQLAKKSMLFANKAILEEKQQALKEAGQINPAINAEIVKLTQLISQNEKSKYSAEQLQNLEQISAAIETESANQIKVLPVENLLTADMNIPLGLPPVIVNGTTFIHIRPISEAFKSSVIWDDSDQTVTITNDQTTIICQIDNPIASVNGNDVTLSEPPRLLDHLTIVPLRFIVENLGLSIDWQDETNTIQISGS